MLYLINLEPGELYITVGAIPTVIQGIALHLKAMDNTLPRTSAGNTTIGENLLNDNQIVQISADSRLGTWRQQGFLMSTNLDQGDRRPHNEASLEFVDRESGIHIVPEGFSTIHDPEDATVE